MTEVENNISNISEEVHESSDDDSDPPPPKIKITVTEEGIPLVWDPKDWMTLREEHRIIGCLVGISVTQPLSERSRALPMLLQPWETTVLLAGEIAVLVYNSSLSSPPSDLIKELFDCYRESIMREQICILQKEHDEEVTQNPETNSEGRTQKLSDLPKKRKLSTDSEPKRDECVPSTSAQGSAEVDQSSIFEELPEIETPTPECTMIQTFTRTPWLSKSDERMVQWRYPCNAQERLLCSVFEDLWRKGYYVTSGETFGGDFLVYPGDPCKFHAQFLVLCVEENSVIRPVEMVSMCRLGNAVHKTVMLAFLKNDEILYQSLTWRPMKIDYNS